MCHLEEIIWERVNVEKDFVSSRISYHKADVTFYFSSYKSGRNFDMNPVT